MKKLAKSQITNTLFKYVLSQPVEVGVLLKKALKFKGISYEVHEGEGIAMVIYTEERHFELLREMLFPPERKKVKSILNNYKDQNEV